LETFDFVGRDHGVPSYLNARRQCGFIANFTTFSDLLAVLPQNHVDLLEAAYESVEDIDFYVGGTLESFTVLNSVFVGETFGCIVGNILLMIILKSFVTMSCSR
jgi:peroxidase